VSELRGIGRDVNLEEFLHEAAIDPEDLYRVSGWTWTELRRRVRLPTDAAGPDEAALARGIRRILHMDDPERLSFYKRFLAEMGPDRVGSLSDREHRMLLGFHFCLWGTDRRWMNLATAIEQLWLHPAFRKELIELLTLKRE
jgi:hypothetical protein